MYTPGPNIALLALYVHALLSKGCIASNLVGGMSSCSLNCRGGWSGEGSRRSRKRNSTSVDSSSSSSSRAFHPGIPTTGQSKNLKKIIQQLEESDYGSFGSWTPSAPKQRSNGRANVHFLHQYSPKLCDDTDFEIVDINDGGQEQSNIGSALQRMSILTSFFNFALSSTSF